jgi:peptide/nickel transport system permease protein
MGLTVSAPPPGDVAAVVPDEVAGRSLWQITWNRIRHDRTAMVCLWILIILYLVAITAPWITSLLGIDPYTLDGSAISENAGAPIGPWGGISHEHPLGVEWGTGRDILAQLLNGLRISLFIATVATVLTVVIGTVLGIVSGYLGGATDAIIGRVIDVIIAFPFLLLILALSGVLTQRLVDMGVPDASARIYYLIIVLSVFGWTYLARIIRGQVFSLREREFVESSVAMGSGTPRILFREILPNLWASILVYTTLTLPAYIGTEAALSFLGVGVLPPDVTFGAMLSNSVSYFNVVPSYLFIPGTLLALIVVAFNLLGDAVRDALDPRAGRV